jgi:hypothetical protein
MCPDAETLAGFADGSISADGRGGVEAHLAACSRCRNEVLGIVAALQSRPARAPEELVGRLIKKEGNRMWTMMRAAAAAAFVVSTITWVVLQDRPRQDLPPTPLPPRVVHVPKDLGGEHRYLAHLSTDKPLYRPGEPIFGRALLLDAFTRKPCAEAIPASFEIRSARGEKVAQMGSASEKGVAAFAWVLPRGLSGGEYTLVARFPNHGFPDAEMTFDVRSYRVPRLKTDLQFGRRGFGPGDEVTATLSAVRAEGTIPAGAKVTAVGTVDGKEVCRQSLNLDSRGIASVRFPLPQRIEDGQGTLAMIIDDGGVSESATKTIPILVYRVSLDFYPEGGDLVAGLESRVYFEARNASKDPADVTGRILDDEGREAARFESTHEGRGRFALTPVPGRRYHAVLDRPSNLASTYELPAVQARGFTLQETDEGFLRVASNETTEAEVAYFQREKEIGRIQVRLPAELALRGLGGDGVLRATVFDKSGLPRAERLIFRRPARSVRMQVQVDPPTATPGSKITVRVKTTDESGRPVSTIVGLSAVDDSSLSMVETRDRAARLPVQALLGAEVRELKDAAAYLADPLKMDLLLGTQGWRRFGFVKTREFLAAHGLLAARALALRIPVAPQLERLRPNPAMPGAVPPPEPVPMELAKAIEDPVIYKAPDEAHDETPDGEQFERERGKEFDALSDKPFKGKSVYDVIRTKYGWGRIYAHARDGRPGPRSDFTETVYWNAGLETDAQGEATFSFHVSDSITTFRVRADGVTAQGALGEADAELAVRRPFYAETKFPLEVTSGDRIELPVALVNGTDSVLRARLESAIGKGLKLIEDPRFSSDVPAGSSVRALLPIQVERDHQGEVEIMLKAQAEPHADDVTRRIRVVPSGYPTEWNFGGLLERIDRHEITIPRDIEPGSLSTYAAVYPSPLASLTEALARMLQEPCGCFEQTSSTNYPNVMVLQYMKTHSGVDPALVKRALEMVERGYQKLVGFECSKKGYEWFGSDPGHEALTAYGLLEFVDMASVMQVDGDMIARTRKWLLGRRDGKGGFQRDPKALDSFGSAPQNITDAYILWALTEAGDKSGLEAELDALRRSTESAEDPYLLALAANVMLNIRDKEAAQRLVGRLAAKLDPEGKLAGAATSITRSGGASLDVETTSLGILAFLRSPSHVASSEKAMRWLLQRCKAGRFGSTQATILALKAIVAYDAAHARPLRPGKVTLRVDGKEAGQVAFPADQQGPIVLPDFAAALTAGKHSIEIAIEGGADMPYALQVKCHARTPASSDRCRVSISTELARAQVQEGEAVDVKVTVSNRADEGVPMVTAVVGLPGALEVRADQLKELVRAGQVDATETRGREVILYWRSMAPRAEHALTLSCVAAVPGEYTGPASRAYLYYTDEHKHWVAPMQIRIARR